MYHKNWTTDRDETLHAPCAQRLDVQSPITTIADFPYDRPFPQKWGQVNPSILALHFAAEQ